MTQSINKRIKALEGQMKTEAPKFTSIHRQIINPDGTYTGEVFVTDLLSDGKETIKIFDQDLKGKVCVVRPKMDDEDS